MWKLTKRSHPSASVFWPHFAGIGQNEGQFDPVCFKNHCKTQPKHCLHQANTTAPTLQTENALPKAPPANHAVPPRGRSKCQCFVYEVRRGPPRKSTVSSCSSGTTSLRLGWHIHGSMYSSSSWRMREQERFQKEMKEVVFPAHYEKSDEKSAEDSGGT